MPLHMIDPYEAFVPEYATRLIIGSVSPQRFCMKDPAYLYKEDVDFYFGSRDLAFWRLLEQLTGVPLRYENTTEAVEERKDLLTQLGIGVVNIIASCDQRNGRTEEKKLQNIQCRRIDKILDKYPNIDTLVYSSRFIIPLMNQFADNGAHGHWDSETLRTSSVQIGGKMYRTHVLFSSAPRALRIISEETRLNNYRHSLLEGEPALTAR